MISVDDVLRKLADSVYNGTCIAVIGAGVSATYKYGNNVFSGLPVGRELVEILGKKRNYLADTKDLGEAAFLFREFEGRGTLEAELRKVYSGRNVNPLPAHKQLAALRLPCYVSLNFDNLLERALIAEEIEHLVICVDKDVSLLTPRHLPVIKPHGTIERPETLAIATDETFSFNERIPIVSSLMLSWLANRTVLFVGFSLSDRDFLELIVYLKRRLGNYMPKSYAISKGSSTYRSLSLESYGVKILDYDATEFLAELNRRVKKLKLQVEEDLEPWMRNKFFWELMEIRGLPTETQVIEALLKEVKERIREGGKADELKQETSEAISLVLSYRRNYSALEKLGQQLTGIFNTCQEKNMNLWDEFSKLESKRKLMSDKLNSKASQVVGNARCILLYSQSKRVVDCLAALDPSKQKDITLYISECRPKSPEPFQDALFTAKLLRNSNYQIRLIPEAPMLHLLKGKTFDLILMGTHSVFKDQSTGNFVSFVNTCGSETIADIASSVGVPLKLIFESEKIVLLKEKDRLQNVSYDEEENIASEVIDVLASDPTLSERVRIVNIGYDLVQWRPNMIAVTDD